MADPKLNPFHKPYLPSTGLATIIGGEAISRPQATKKLWAYIKHNGLHDSANRRMINIDVLLELVFPARTQVSMFDLAKMLKRELLPI